jgi:hypothetical protein
MSSLYNGFVVPIPTFPDVVAKFAPKVLAIVGNVAVPVLVGLLIGK